MSESRTDAQFRESLEDGNRFADFAQRVLWNNGIACFPHRSAYYQWTCGESQQGIEFKFDRMFRETHNFFIETKERRTTDGQSGWRPSGIFEEPPPRIFAIGDYQTVYLLPVRVVVLIAGSGRWGDPHPNKTNTAYGYLVPVREAATWAIDIFEVPA